MSKLGFRCFTSPEAPVVLTPRQQLGDLSDAQRDAILNGFEQRIPAGQLDHKIGIGQDILRFAYDGIGVIEEQCRLLMRGEVVVTPEVSHIDPVTLQKVIDTPAVFNTPPTTQVQLRNAVSPYFIVDYPQLFITNTIQEMVTWSKWDGTGTFAFYKTQIIL